MGKLRSTWNGMMDRCYNPNNKSYKHYGGRGIYVADEWHSYYKFVADVGPKPKDKSLDRIDVNGPYSKENCRWADRATQATNKQIKKLICIYVILG